MANHKISGTGLLPGGAGPLLGAWHLGIFSTSGIAFDADGSTWRGLTESRNVNNDGSLEWTGLPETTADFRYVAWFETVDRRHTYGRYVFELTADITWQTVITTPTLLPIPSDLAVQLIDAIITKAGATDGQIAIYDATADKYKPGPAPAGGGVVTYGTTAGTAAEGNDARVVAGGTAVQPGALSAYAPKASPTFSGTVSGVTAAMVGAPTTAAMNTAISTAVNGLVNGAPGALDQLNELAAAMGNDANFAATVTNALALKAPIASPTFTGTVSGVTKSHVGLGNVDNTSDAMKLAAAKMQWVQQAVGGAWPARPTADGTTLVFWRGIAGGASPLEVTSGTGGMLRGVDVFLRIPA